MEVIKKIFGGVCTALVTPFVGGVWGETPHSNEIDYIALKNLINNQIDAKTDALLVLGTTGEAATLTTNEKQNIIKFAIATISKRVPVIVGIGGNNPAAVIELGLFAKSAGADAVMVTAPYYNKATQHGIVEFFRVITEAVQMPLIMYNVPGRTGVNIEPATAAKICALPWVAGIKEASGDMNQIAAVLNACPGTPVYCGDDGLALPCYVLGAAGVISVASNARPAVVKKVWSLFGEGKINAARKLFMSELGFYKSLFCEVNPIPIKFVLAKQGLVRNELRLPLTPLSKEHEKIFKIP